MRHWTGLETKISPGDNVPPSATLQGTMTNTRHGWVMAAHQALKVALKLAPTWEIKKVVE